MARTNPSEFFERSTAFFAAYITTPTGGLITNTWVAASGIVCKVYDETTGTLVHTYTMSATDLNLLPDSLPVLSSTANQGYGWPDSIGWVLGMVRNTSEWNTAAGSVGNRTYRLEWSITMATAPTAPTWLASKVLRFTQRARCLPLTG